MKLTIFDLHGKNVSSIELDPSWEERLNTAILLQAVAMYRNNLRAGLASTKTRSDVSGGGKKPFKQKHTGRARAGSNRSPLWRHGGSVFGPRPREMRYQLPQAMRRVALFESLKGKVRDEELIVIDDLSAKTPKTKPFAGLSKTFEVRRKSVIVLDNPSEALVKSLRNLRNIALCRASNLTAFDVLNAHKVIVSKQAFEQLQQRVKGNGAASSN